MRKRKTPHSLLRSQAVGRRLALVREALGLTQTEVAKTLGVYRNVVGRIEAGEIELRTEHLSVLAEHYRISPNWVLLGVGPVFLISPSHHGCDVTLNSDEPALGIVTASLSLFAESRVRVFARLIVWQITAPEEEAIQFVGLAAVDEWGALYNVGAAKGTVVNLTPFLIELVRSQHHELSGQIVLKGRLDKRRDPTHLSFLPDGSFVAGSVRAISGGGIHPDMLLSWLTLEPTPLRELESIHPMLASVLKQESPSAVQKVLACPWPPPEWVQWALRRARDRIKQARGVAP